MSVVTNDYRFATASVPNVFRPFASAHDCGSHECHIPRVGKFQVDVSGTDFLLPGSIPYWFGAWPQCFRKVFNGQMSPDRRQWSGYCGGHCGGCYTGVFHLLIDGC